jgi:MFS family permease
MVAIGGVLGSLLFGFLSDIFGRRNVIRSTLFIITITTLIFAGISFGLDEFTKRRYEEVDNSEEYKTSKLFSDYGDTLEIIKELYVQEKVRNFFKKIFFIFCFIIFILSAALWPLLKSCMALLIENAKSELTVLIGFRRYNFFFGGLPAFFTSLIFVNVNNFPLTFFILAIINLIFFIYSLIFLEESIRFFY